VVTPEAEAVSRQWRAKPLEYRGLRSLMGRDVDFWTVTEEALRFALKHFAVGITPTQHAMLLKAYSQLSAYPEIPATLAALAPQPRLILSNGRPSMLQAAVESSGLAGKFSYMLSADQVRVYKPDPRVYALVPEVLGLAVDVGSTGRGLWSPGWCRFASFMKHEERRGGLRGNDCGDAIPRL
jgi:2-haloacid dehalogenase